MSYKSPYDAAASYSNEIRVAFKPVLLLAELAATPLTSTLAPLTRLATVPLRNSVLAL